MPKSLHFYIPAGSGYDRLPVVDRAGLVSTLGYTWLRVAAYLQWRSVLPYGALDGPYIRPNSELPYPVLPADGRLLRAQDLLHLNHGDLLLFDTSSIGCYMWQTTLLAQTTNSSDARAGNIVNDVYWLATCANHKPAYVSDVTSIDDLLSKAAIRILPGPNNWRHAKNEVVNPELNAEILKLRL